MLGREGEIKMFLGENDIDKKSSQSTINRSDFGSAINIPDLRFVKVSPERKKLHRLNTLQISSSNGNNLDKIQIIQEANDELTNRKDKFNTVIKKGKKEHKVTFKEDFLEKIEIESFKDMNKPIDAKIINRCSNCAC